jgi:hypothetical protein
MAEVTDYKPRPDTYDAIEVECGYGIDGRPNQLDRVRVRWYEDGTLTISVKGGAPALLSRCYLEGEGRDVILRLEPV